MKHIATVEWQRGGAAFTDRRYPRAHRWRFDGGAEVAASSSPHVVPVPYSDPAAVDPESGYRFYAPDQLDRARLIATLRRIGMPLAEIRRVCGLEL